MVQLMKLNITVEILMWFVYTGMNVSFTTQSKKDNSVDKHWRHTIVPVRTVPTLYRKVFQFLDY